MEYWEKSKERPKTVFLISFASNSTINWNELKTNGKTNPKRKTTGYFKRVTKEIEHDK